MVQYTIYSMLLPRCLTSCNMLMDAATYFPHCVYKHAGLDYILSEKLALLRPFFKKPGLDVVNMSYYRPVPDFFLSKVLERAMLPLFVQSAYKQHHSK